MEIVLFVVFVVAFLVVLDVVLAGLLMLAMHWFNL